MTRNIFVYDTTLHNSQDWPAPPLSPFDIQQIAMQLDALGVDYIEVSAIPPETGGESALRILAELSFQEAKLTSALRLSKAQLPADDRSWLQTLKSVETPASTLVVSGLDVLEIESEAAFSRSLQNIRRAIRELKATQREVFLEIEDFFNAYKEQSWLIDRLIRIEGADRIILNETAGQTLPWEAGKMVHEVLEAFPQVDFGIHFHDAGYSAIAGALTAVDQGVVQIQGSINGFGTRSGEANLCNILPDLQLKMGYICVPEGKLPGLVDMTQYLMNASNNAVEPLMGYVGKSALNPV